MKLSFNSWLYGSAYGWLPTRSLEDTIDTLAEIGYDGIEIGAAAPHAFPAYLSRERRDTLVNYLSERRLSVSALCTAFGGAPGYNPIAPEAEERRAGVQYVADCCRLAHDLQCPNVQWAAGWMRYGQSRAAAWNYAVEGLAEAASVARPLGVKLLVEPVAEVSDLVEHVGDALRLIKDAGVEPEVAGVLVDTIHVFYRGDDIRAALREAGDRLEYIHISDIERDVPGTHTDFRSTIDELKLLGYDGWLSVEIGFPRRERDPDGIARAAHEYMTSVLDTSAARLAPWRHIDEGA